MVTVLSIRCATCGATAKVRADDVVATCPTCFEAKPLAADQMVRIRAHANKLSRAETRAHEKARGRREDVLRLRAQFMIVTPALTFVCALGAVQLPLVAIPRVRAGEISGAWLAAEPFLVFGASIGLVACAYAWRWYRSTKAPPAMAAIAPVACPCGATVPVPIGRKTECPMCCARLEPEPEVVERIEADTARRIAREQARVRTSRRWMRLALVVLVLQAVLAIALEVVGSGLPIF